MEFEFSNSTIQLDKKQDFSYSQKICDLIWLVVADGHSAFSQDFYDNKIGKIIQHKCNDCGEGQDWEKEGNNYNVLWL